MSVPPNGIPSDAPKKAKKKQEKKKKNPEDVIFDSFSSDDEDEEREEKNLREAMRRLGEKKPAPEKIAIPPKGLKGTRTRIAVVDVGDNSNGAWSEKALTTMKPPSPAVKMGKDALLSPKAKIADASSKKQQFIVEDVELPYSREDSVAFFDLDHTVVDTNSSWLWVQHEVNRGRVGANMILTALYWFGRYALGYGAGAERAGSEAAETYKGVLEAKLRGDVEMFFHEELKHRIRPGCVPVMQAHKRRNQRLIMCTSTWQHPAETAARMFGFETGEEDVICSHMQVTEDGVLNGKLEKIAYGDEKYERTKEWAIRNNIDLKKCYFYTDSYSDLKLMEHVGYPVAVNPDPRLMKHAESRGWEIVDWGIAPVKAKKPRYHYGCLNGARQSYH